MALLSRYLLQVEDPDFVSRAPELFRDWVRWKLKEPRFELPEDGQTLVLPEGSDLRIRSASVESDAGFRGSYFEQRPDEQIRTTFTALADGEERWAWIDLERWSPDPFKPDWIPAPPRLLRSILDGAACRRGPTRLQLGFEAVTGEEGARVAAEVLDPAREVPIVITTPTDSELRRGMGPARGRAESMSGSLAGIAPVVLLEKGALAAFSKAMLAAGPRMDIHGGAVRTYLPGAGAPGDSPRRHRVIPYERLRTRPADTALRLVQAPLTRAAGHTVPPRIWAEKMRDPLVIGDQPPSDADLEELLELAERERREAEERAERAEDDKRDAESQLEDERETVSELVDLSGRLSKRLEFAQGQIRKSGETPLEPSESIQMPEFCSEVTELVETHLPGVVIGPRVKAAAEQLDEHGQPSWARKAWRSFQALQAYVDSKHGGDEGSSNFIGFCERGLHSDVIPISWIASGESETTDQNQGFRSLRTFPVPERVEASGQLYMPAHIKLEQGGYPAPRIHFYDDTDGVSKSIQIGWFGPHLDNKAKS